MKRTFLRLLAVGSFAAAAADARAAFNEGDPVVARWKGSWVSATVVSATPATVELKIEIGRHPEGADEPQTEIVSLPAADVSAVPLPETAPPARRGDLVLAQFDRLWLPRRFKAVKDLEITLVNAGDEEETHSVGGVLVPPGAWRAAVSSAWEAGTDLSALAETNEHAPVGLGSPVKPGDLVLYGWVVPGETARNWSEGKVKSAVGKVRVIPLGVDGPQKDLVDVEPAQVAPRPSSRSAPAVKLGDVVLYGHYYFAHHIPWLPGRVDGICGSSILLTTRTGGAHAADPGGFIPVQK